MKWLFASISTFSNFYEIYFYKFFKKMPNYLRLWNGAKFKVLNLNSNLGTILEVWRDNVYAATLELKGKKGLVIVDIGANIGAFTIFALRKFNNPKIFAYEPETNNFTLLCKTLNLNNGEDFVKVFKKAVYGRVGVINLSLAGESSGKNSVEIDQGLGQFEKVECTTLASVIEDNKISFCDLLKIDCEGSEYEILFNSPTEVLEKVGMIILEWHNVVGYSVSDLVKFLESVGFNVERSEKNESLIVARRTVD